MLISSPLTYQVLQCTMSNRIASFDAMRTYAVILGVVVHAASAYLVHPVPQWPNLPQSNILFDCIAWIIHMFRVPVFFFIAGFFAYQLWRKKGRIAFIKNRFLRVFLPLVICSFIFNIPTLLTNLFYRRLHNLHDVLTVCSNLSYTWFLEYLMIYYLLFLILMAGSSMLRTERFTRKILTGHLHAIIFIIVPVWLWYSSQQYYIPISLSVIPRVDLLLFYGCYFFLGVMMGRHEESLAILFKWRWSYVFSALVALISNMVMMWRGERQLLVIIFYAIASYLLFYCFIAGCIRFFSRENRFHRYVAEASYWIYLVQVYLILRMQEAFSSFNNIFIQFTATCIITVLISLFSYDVLIRSRRKSESTMMAVKP